MCELRLLLSIFGACNLFPWATFETDDRKVWALNTLDNEEGTSDKITWELPETEFCPCWLGDCPYSWLLRLAKNNWLKYLNF